MIADVFVSFVAIVTLCVMFYTVWQDLCVEYARHIIFEQRDKLFDFASEGRLEFTSQEYISVRSFLNSMIRFAHNITITNFTFMLLFSDIFINIQNRRTETNLYRALNAIKDYDLKSDVEKLVAKATVAIIIMMIFRSFLCVLFICIIAIPGIIVVRCVGAVRAKLRVFVSRLGNIIQHEVEYATE
jgi:hypothetical protein